MDAERSATGLHRCLELAEEARSGGDAPVGAVILKGDAMIAEAFEQVQALKDVTAHAELLAIKAACQVLKTMDLSGCTLVTNVEPCWMCSFAIRETGLSRVVIGMAVEQIGGATSRYPILTDAGIDGWGSPPEVVWGTGDDGLWSDGLKE